jgi:hypothetical protein
MGAPAGIFVLKEDGQPFTRPQLSDQWLRERDSNAALAPLRHCWPVDARAARNRRGEAPQGRGRHPADCRHGGDEPQMVTRYCRFSVQRENALAAVVYLDRTPREQGAQIVEFRASNPMKLLTAIVLEVYNASANINILCAVNIT